VAGALTVFVMILKSNRKPVFARRRKDAETTLKPYVAFLCELGGFARDDFNPGLK
jgi:hypothetical protein